MEKGTVFKRYELKYILTAEQKKKILETVNLYMDSDRFGKSTIRNVYYDTDDYLMIRRSIEKPAYKEKLRMRSYRAVGMDKEAFVEIKKKYDGVVYKRRVSMPRETAEDFLAGKKECGGNSQIIDEIRYFIRFYGHVYPKAFISYDREAFLGRTDDSFRVTFDENILWRPKDLSLGKGIYGQNILDPELTLMEIKTAKAIPLWMVKVMSEEKICRTSFSKYGSAYMQLMNKRKGELKNAQ